MNQYPLIKGKTDLKTRFPEIARQWDFEKNTELTPEDVQPGSMKRYGGCVKKATVGKPLFTAGRLERDAHSVQETV